MTIETLTIILALVTEKLAIMEDWMEENDAPLWVNELIHNEVRKLIASRREVESALMAAEDEADVSRQRIRQADPELERLLAEEIEIEKNARRHHRG